MQAWVWFYWRKLFDEELRRHQTNPEFAQKYEKSSDAGKILIQSALPRNILKINGSLTIPLSNTRL